MFNDLDEFEKHLKETYPEMYQNVYCGIYIDKGWFNLVDALSRSIYNYVKSNHTTYDILSAKNSETDYEKVEYPSVVQIKEKFGDLRFYVDGSNRYVDGMIDMAEQMSIHICEVCGNPGEKRDTNWIKVLCDEHYVKHHPV
jgi:hypothetical protein